MPSFDWLRALHNGHQFENPSESLSIARDGDDFHGGSVARQQDLVVLYSFDLDHVTLTFEMIFPATLLRYLGAS